ncbi:DUF547 domain-containing protein [Magnetococcus sp. PR-3]|uniref:DUF547 domain-containing protein n=1 Tax=Magnetococcus sp. PR-3 TaxID=3120355 RepID=UPI002FCDF724
MIGYVKGNWAVVVVILGMMIPQAQAGSQSWPVYDALLQTYVKVGHVERGLSLNWVDYQGLKSDPRWERVVIKLQETPVESLQTKADKLAFYINAYNILAIKMVIDNWPVKSIKDVGSWLWPVWKHNAGIVHGKLMTLDELEHKILRKLAEPRIHFAIVCASRSCPDLRPTAYSAESLDQQLDEQTRLFLANSVKGLYRSGNTVHVSQIFHWFKSDFVDLPNFLRHHTPKAWPSGKIQADIPYDWALNGH